VCAVADVSRLDCLVSIYRCCSYFCRSPNCCGVSTGLRGHFYVCVCACCVCVSVRVCMCMCVCVFVYVYVRVYVFVAVSQLDCLVSMYRCCRCFCRCCNCFFLYGKVLQQMCSLYWTDA